MTEKILDLEEYVEQMALVLNLPINPDHKPGTLDNFARIAAIAQIVLEFPLPPDIEAASIYQPTFEP